MKCSGDATFLMPWHGRRFKKVHSRDDIVPSLADRFVSYWYNNYFLHISCKFSVDVFGEDANNFIDHSSPFFDLERERSKILRLRPKEVEFL